MILFYPNQNGQCGEIQMITNAGTDIAREDIFCCQEVKLVPSLWNLVWRFLKIIEIDLAFDQAVPFLGLSSMVSMLYYRVSCTVRFIVVLFTIARKENSNQLSINNCLGCGT